LLSHAHQLSGQLHYPADTVVVTVRNSVAVVVLIIPVTCEPAKSVTGMIVKGAGTEEAVAPPDETGVAGGNGAAVEGASEEVGGVAGKGATA
jgi:hypothetical protein